MNKNKQNNANKMYEEFTKNAKPEDQEKIAENLDSVNKGALAKIWDKVKKLWAIVKNPKISFVEKIPAIGALLYAVSPLDVIPDAILCIGFIDDAFVVTLALAGLGHLLVKYVDIIFPDDENETLA